MNIFKLNPAGEYTDAKSSLELSEADVKRTAKKLGVDSATIYAIKTVESGVVGGFLYDRRPTIKFEGDVFWKQLEKYGIDPEKSQKGNEDIIYKTWTRRYYSSRIKEYERLYRAIAIHKDAAISSASWGLFQIMGFNYRACGCESVQEFVNEMHSNEGNQLDLFANFVITNSLEGFLKNREWGEFSLRYKGQKHKGNRYKKKLLNAYNEHKKEKKIRLIIK